MRYYEFRYLNYIAPRYRLRYYTKVTELWDYVNYHPSSSSPPNDSTHYTPVATGDTWSYHPQQHPLVRTKVRNTTDRAN